MSPADTALLIHSHPLLAESEEEMTLDVPLLVNDFLRRATNLYPDKTAIVDDAQRFSYAEFQERANRLSNALLGLGVRRGDRVCILSPNSHFFFDFVIV